MARRAGPPRAGLGSHIVTSDDQMTLTGKPGTSRTGRVKVTNVGTKPLTVRAAARDYRTFASSQQKVPFDSRTLPTFATSDGGARAEKQIHFTVPSGGQRLLVRMAYQGTGPSDYMRLALFDPSGAFVASNSPQGTDPPANYANVDVRNPAAGDGPRCCTRAQAQSATTPHRSSSAATCSEPYRSARSAPPPSVSVPDRAGACSPRSGCPTTAATRRTHSRSPPRPGSTPRSPRSCGR